MPPLSEDAKTALTDSLRIALSYGDDGIEPEHLFMALRRAPGPAMASLLGDVIGADWKQDLHYAAFEALVSVPAALRREGKWLVVRYSVDLGTPYEQMGWRVCGLYDAEDSADAILSAAKELDISGEYAAFQLGEDERGSVVVDPTPRFVGARPPMNRMLELSVEDVEALRGAAGRVNAGVVEPAEHDDPREAGGWRKLCSELADLLRAFPSLSLREGYELRAYVFHEFWGGHGVIFAAECGSEFPEPHDAGCLADGGLAPGVREAFAEDFPELGVAGLLADLDGELRAGEDFTEDGPDADGPESASAAELGPRVGRFMQAIRGDGSPRSLFEASIFVREAEQARRGLAWPRLGPPDGSRRRSLEGQHRDCRRRVVEPT